MLAEAIILFFGVFLLGLLGFALACISVFWRAVAWLFGGRRRGPGVGGAMPRVLPDGHWQCTHAGCRHLNRPGASFCASCGRPLRDPRDVDAYG